MTAAVGPTGPRTGVVTSFDPDTGWGAIDDGGTEYSFHATAISDGSRTIDRNQPVVFVVEGGRAGLWEATRIVAV